ncbi:hypothetical protein GF357_02345 [Candidatus Dojkabacteria bacterium]|nr:hypothetical protein [Candidatus Dojkabacteria bacterium]
MNMKKTRFKNKPIILTLAVVLILQVFGIILFFFYSKAKSEGEGLSKIVEQSSKSQQDYSDGEDELSQQTEHESDNGNSSGSDSENDSGQSETPNEQQAINFDDPSANCPEVDLGLPPGPPGYKIDSADWAAYPTKISPVTKDPNDLLVLVNKKFQLPQDYEPEDLTDLGVTEVRGSSGKSGRQVIVDQLRSLGQAAKDDGIDLAVKSGYRSYDTQIATYNYWVSVEDGNESEADKYSARPGHSQHQLGTTIDFTTNECGDCIGDNFTGTKAQAWLSQNAWRYGFALSYPIEGEFYTGYLPESWHYRFIGVDNAACWKDSGLVLDSWLFQVGQ